MLCNEKQDLMDELSLLKDVFIANGYPEKLVKDTLEKSWEVETLKAVLVGVQQEVKAENRKNTMMFCMHLMYKVFRRACKGN